MNFNDFIYIYMCVCVCVGRGVYYTSFLQKKKEFYVWSLSLHEMTHQLYWIIISLFTYQFYNLCVMCLKTYYSCVARACALRDTFWFITFFMCLWAMCLVSISNSNSKERKKHWHHCICVSLSVSFRGGKKKTNTTKSPSISLNLSQRYFFFNFHSPFLRVNVGFGDGEFGSKECRFFTTHLSRS